AGWVPSVGAPEQKDGYREAGLAGGLERSDLSLPFESRTRGPFGCRASRHRSRRTVISKPGSPAVWSEATYPFHLSRGREARLAAERRATGAEGRLSRSRARRRFGAKRLIPSI